MTKQLALRLLAAPFTGAAFVLFLPFIGFVLVGVAIFQKIRMSFSK